MNEVEREELLASFLAGECREEQKAALLKLLQADPAFVDEAARLKLLERLVRYELGPAQDKEFVARVTGTVFNPGASWEDPHSRGGVVMGKELNDADLAKVAGGCGGKSKKIKIKKAPKVKKSKGGCR
jgi:hypothetical protein